ncbi:phosphotransferase, partial [Candidatus Saccharibacteria bacterium]|nr:phosphotransferase [Candidatus Saccharibacteria bacterium]
LADIASAFDLGEYQTHEPILLGYEDLNARLDTSDGTFFVKFFLKDRTDAECERYARVMQAVVDAGINHPAISRAQGDAIYRPKGTNLRAVVMEWLESTKDFEQERPSDEELVELVNQATRINRLDVKLPEADFIYDSWAISNFPKEYKKWRHVLSEEDKALVEPVLADYEALDVDSLPTAFVHGDLIRTNVMKTRNGIYVFDFAVSNVYPRVQELAVLLCDMFFDPNSEEETSRLYGLLLTEYQKHIQLTPDELKALPVFVRAAHAMHVLGGARGEDQGDGGEENDMWWNLGRIGLKMKVYATK